MNAIQGKQSNNIQSKFRTILQGVIRLPGNHTKGQLQSVSDTGRSERSVTILLTKNHTSLPPQKAHQKIPTTRSKWHHVNLIAEPARRVTPIVVVTDSHAKGHPGLFSQMGGHLSEVWP